MSTTKRNPSSLQVVAFNADGLKRQRLQLEEFARREDIDVIMISETHLRAADEPKIANYALYRTDRENRRGGGTAIYVRASIDHYPVTLSDLQDLEATAVVINTATNGPIRFISAYHPPQRRLCECDLDAVLDSDSPTIIAGDLNAKHTDWNSRSTNTKGRVLQKYADDKDIVIMGPDEPTHFATCGTSDVLDIAILKGVSLPCRITTVNELDSDHNPVFLFLGDADHEEDLVERTRTCWPAFADHLQETLPRITPIRTVGQLEEAVDTLTSAIKHSLTATSRRHRAPRHHMQIPDELKELIAEKNQARRRYQRSWDPLDRSIRDRLRMEVKEALQELRNAAWEAKLDSLEDDDRSYWRMAKALRNKSAHMPPIHGENGVVFSVPEKAEAFADSFERQCTPNFVGADLDHIELVEAEVRRKLRDHGGHLRPTNPAEVKNRIQLTNVRKASGPDGINNKVLQQLPVRAVSCLTNIVNAMLRLRHFPCQWKCADVIMLQKPGQAGTFPQNYRPISLLATMGKIAEGIVLQRLRTEVEERNAIPDEQFGFREQHSAVHQVLRVVEHVSKGFNWKRSTGAVFLDVSKAFDKVWHEGLLYKLLEAGIHPGLVRLVSSFLKDRTFRIRLGDVRSTVRNLESGVPQGSLLSPLLFNVFTRDMPRSPGTELALYADDTAITAESHSPDLVVQRLQVAAEELERWFTKWRITVNPEKSSALFMTKRKKRHPRTHVTMFGEEIPWKETAKYLGVKLDRGLTWRAHIDERAGKARAAIACLFPLFSHRSKLSVRNKIRLHTAIIRPMMTYASEAWGTAAKTHLHKMEVVQMKALRMAVNAPWFVRNSQILQETTIPPIAQYIRESAKKTFAAMDQHPNHLVSALGDYDEEQPHRHKRPRMILSNE